MLGLSFAGALSLRMDDRLPSRLISGGVPF